MKRSSIFCLALMSFITFSMLSCSDDNEQSSEPLGQSHFLYRFGTLSDIHLNAKWDSTFYSFNDFKRALAYYKAMDADFTAICGDLTYYGFVGIDAFKKDLSIYRSIRDSTSMPLYVCAGNHDCDTVGYKAEVDSIWKQYTGCQRNYVMEHKGDVFIFLSMNAYNMKKGLPPYRDADIDWLEAQLAKYAKRRVLLFTHLFLHEYAGDFMQLYNKVGILQGVQYDRMKALLAKYPNVINFSGHSHFRWYLQNYDSRADECQIPGGAYTIHLPSCAFPRDATYSGFLDNIYSSATSNWTSAIRGEQSEIGYVDVYDDHIIVQGLQLTGNPTQLSSQPKNDYQEVKGARFRIDVKQ